MPVAYVLYLALAAGMLAGITGWNHPDSETRAMSRAAGIITALIAAVIAIRSQW
ncbi:hypothetical protein PV396_24505 [Streptomyces sp. ME02-8801-2C]|uniref:hypothetical protein n=1 Tax=Streptomyces sp. ME02-8801-2C TaxID=3028680 RepID=UPI0029B2C4CB|nr:hypothetical protein [Streptomyces sp. ME02-8801-2C]MDX3455064.1 hypothetical protein [Streptomyces sp. ME02-8801-2C]